MEGVSVSYVDVTAFVVFFVWHKYHTKIMNGVVVSVASCFLPFLVVFTQLPHSASSLAFLVFQKLPADESSSSHLFWCFDLAWCWHQLYISYSYGLRPSVDIAKLFLRVGLVFAPIPSRVVVAFLLVEHFRRLMWVVSASLSMSRRTKQLMFDLWGLGIIVMILLRTKFKFWLLDFAAALELWETMLLLKYCLMK